MRHRVIEKRCHLSSRRSGRGLEAGTDIAIRDGQEKASGSGEEWGRWSWVWSWLSADVSQSRILPES